MKSEIRKLTESFGFARRGLALCLRRERNLRIHITVACYVLLFSFLGGASVMQYAVLCLCFGLVMGGELLNTAIERLCDKAAQGYDPLVRDAKDIAAAAVFVCAIASALVGLFIFLGGGLLQAAVLVLLSAWWRAALVLFSLPFALWFVFYYGRIR